MEIPRPKSHDIEIPRLKNRNIKIPRPKIHDIEFLCNSDLMPPDIRCSGVVPLFRNCSVVSRLFRVPSFPSLHTVNCKSSYHPNMVKYFTAAAHLNIWRCMRGGEKYKSRHTSSATSFPFHNLLIGSHKLTNELVLIHNRHYCERWESWKWIPGMDIFIA